MSLDGVRMNGFKTQLGGISGQGFDARDKAGNALSVIDFQGPKSEMDKMFGPPGSFDSKSLTGGPGGNKAGQPGGPGGAGQQGQQGNPFGELSKMFGKDSAIGKLLDGIGKMFGGDKAGQDQKAGGEPKPGGETGKPGGEETKAPGGDNKPEETAKTGGDANGGNFFDNLFGGNKTEPVAKTEGPGNDQASNAGQPPAEQPKTEPTPKEPETKEV